jgi:hypothetical protein
MEKIYGPPCRVRVVSLVGYHDPVLRGGDIRENRFGHVGKEPDVHRLHPPLPILQSETTKVTDSHVIQIYEAGEPVQIDLRQL